MENASKALLIAGGVLLALLIIVVLLRTYGGISSFQKTKLSQEEAQQIEEFNKQYTKYLGQYVYGTEVISLQHKFENDGMVEVKIEEGKTPEQKNGWKKDQNTFSYTNETTYYKCTNIGYNTSTGRVNSIIFKQITLNSGV